MGGGRRRGEVEPAIEDPTEKEKHGDEKVMEISNRHDRDLIRRCDRHKRCDRSAAVFAAQRNKVSD
jgi:hypothetical protein